MRELGFHSVNTDEDGLEPQTIVNGVMRAAVVESMEASDESRAEESETF